MSDLDHIRGGKMTKTERYKWLEPGKPGEFRWIHKSKIFVDHTYQRKNIRQRTLDHIKKNWSWMCCLTLGVIERAVDVYFVFEGQHRKLGADYRAEISDLPCMVWPESSLSDEAKAFLAVNTMRGPMRSYEKFRAEIVAGDPAAIRVEALLAISNLTTSETTASGNGSVSCVAAMKDFASLPNADELFRLLILIQTPPTSQLVRGFCVAEKWLSCHGLSLLDRNNRERLLHLGKDQLIDSIYRAKVYRGKGGEKSEADGIISALNKGRSSKRIPSIYGSDA